MTRVRMMMVVVDLQPNPDLELQHPEPAPAPAPELEQPELEQHLCPRQGACDGIEVQKRREPTLEPKLEPTLEPEPIPELAQRMVVVVVGVPQDCDCHHPFAPVRLFESVRPPCRRE